MKELGIHVLMEFSDCSVGILDDLKCLEVVMEEAALASKATIIKSVFHQFSPHGVTGVVVVAESHLAIHTWPEHGYAAVDFFTCNTSMDYLKTYDYLVEKLNAKSPSYQTVKRGFIPQLKELNGV
jgi:S-adenosylmethionine decarboxylase proenzyme